MAVGPGPHPDRSGAAPQAWTLRGLLTVAFLGVAAGVQMSDVGLQAVSLSAIQQTFEVGDTAIGSLQGLAGILVGSALAIPLARFADSVSRKWMLLGLIAVAMAMMILSGLAPNFPLFFIGRSVAGITEFAMVPLVYSMIPDLAPESQRVGANLSFAALMAIGASAGFYFSGPLLAAADLLFAGQAEAWRKAFLLLSTADLPLLVLGLLISDPARRLAARSAPASASVRVFLRRNWRAVLLFLGVAGCLLVAVQALNQLIALALERQFLASKGEIGRAMGTIVLLTSLGCLPVAGLLDRAGVHRLGAAVRPLVMGVAVALAVPVLLLLVTTQKLDQAFVAVGVFLFLACTANALVPTMLQDLTAPAIRARCFALWSFVVSLFGAGGPLLAGILSDHVFSGRLLAAIVAAGVPVLGVSAFCALRLFRYCRRNPAVAAGGVPA